MITLARSLLMMVGVLFFVVPQVVLGADIIRDFTSDIKVHEDGTFLVTETIIYDFGNEYRHGIFRTLELSHPQEASSWYKKRSIGIDVQEVLFDGSQAKYTQSTSGDEIEIKIGDADVTITGVHTYVISYLVHGGLIDSNGQPELYWNATGADWVGPLELVTVLVSGPENALGVTQTCYKGAPGQTLSCGAIATSSSVVTFAASGIMPGQQVTIAQSLDGSIVENSVVETVSFYLIVLPLLLLLCGVALFKAYRFQVKHATGSTIIAQYEPYPGVLPMYSGLVVDGSLDPKDITAGIVYLAQQGFIKIKKTDRKVLFLFEVTDYEITLLRSMFEAPTAFHTVILSLLFTEKEIGEVTSLSKLKKNTSKQKENFKALTRLKQSIKEDLLEQGFYESAFSFNRNYVLGVLLTIAGIGYMSFVAIGEAGLFLVGFVVLLCGGIIAVIVYRRRTRKGYEAKQHILGFKEFLSVTDKERFAFHNAPEKSPEQFMEYLPYAVALGVEDKWAEVFKNVTIASPDWYDGGATNSAFVASSLTRDIGAFSSSFATSSGTSPSSGGGSSGGGSGGGGGGSW